MTQERRFTCLPVVAALVSCGFVTLRLGAQDQSKTPQSSIPKTWVDAEIAEMEIPLAHPEGSPRHISAEYYYRIPVRQVYRTYSVYAPGREPAGYLEWLKQQEPEVVFDVRSLRTEADWINAGERVFENPIAYVPLTDDIPVRNHAYVNIGLTERGINPYQRYVVREKGKVELGVRSCADCHTRLLPDGTVVKGAQSNFPSEQAVAFAFEQNRTPAAVILSLPRFRLADIDTTPTFDELIGQLRAIPPGVMTRHRTSLRFPVQIPDLIGVKDRKYLDRTGLQPHRSVVDLTRYAAANQGADELANFGTLIAAAKDAHTLPDASTQARYSDEQLYALALYVYSLKPPPNPNTFDAVAKRGEKVFQSQRCPVCHTPPLYTNNKLTPATGFNVPEEHKKKYDILPIPVGTDPNLTLNTKRGTGYYKVPSLKGVWYRGPFEHSGSVATLEDWFDGRRLRDDYVPTGFKGFGVQARAVKGHEFGLHLSVEEKRALIAFLKTL